MAKSSIGGASRMDVLMAETPARLAEQGRPILLINPIKGLVGTLVREQPIDDPQWWRDPERYGLTFVFPGSTGKSAEIRVDPLEACRLHPDFGLLTPAMMQVLAARKQVEEEASRIATANPSTARLAPTASTSDTAPGWRRPDRAWDVRVREYLRAHPMATVPEVHAGISLGPGITHAQLATYVEHWRPYATRLEPEKE